jgi:hypothetical protein
MLDPPNEARSRPLDGTRELAVLESVAKLREGVAQAEVLANAEASLATSRRLADLSSRSFCTPTCEEGPSVPGGGPGSPARPSTWIQRGSSTTTGIGRFVRDW